MKLANDFHASTLSQLIAYNILTINKKSYELHVENLCEYYKKQSQSMSRALKHELSDFATWSNPKGGIFVWLSFNFPVDTTKLLRACIKKGFSYVPGEMFYSEPIVTNKLRLCFSSASESEMFAAMSCLREEVEIELAKQDWREAVAV
jgi:2-aminoadipate transaminase